MVSKAGLLLQNLLMKHMLFYDNIMNSLPDIERKWENIQELILFSVEK